MNFANICRVGRWIVDKGEFGTVSIVFCLCRKSATPLAPSRPNYSPETLMFLCELGVQQQQQEQQGAWAVWVSPHIDTSATTSVLGQPPPPFPSLFLLLSLPFCQHSWLAISLTWPQGGKRESGKMCWLFDNFICRWNLHVCGARWLICVASAVVLF